MLEKFPITSGRLQMFKRAKQRIDSQHQEQLNARKKEYNPFLRKVSPMDRTLFVPMQGNYRAIPKQ